MLVVATFAWPAASQTSASERRPAIEWLQNEWRPQRIDRTDCRSCPNTLAAAFQRACALRTDGGLPCVPMACEHTNESAEPALARFALASIRSSVRRPIERLPGAMECACSDRRLRECDLRLARANRVKCYRGRLGVALEPRTRSEFIGSIRSATASTHSSQARTAGLSLSSPSGMTAVIA